MGSDIVIVTKLDKNMLAQPNPTSKDLLKLIIVQAKN